LLVADVDVNVDVNVNVDGDIDVDGSECKLTNETKSPGVN